MTIDAQKVLELYYLLLEIVVQNMVLIWVQILVLVLFLVQILVRVLLQVQFLVLNLCQNVKKFLQIQEVRVNLVAGVLI